MFDIKKIPPTLFIVTLLVLVVVYVGTLAASALTHRRFVILNMEVSVGEDELTAERSRNRKSEEQASAEIAQLKKDLATARAAVQLLEAEKKAAATHAASIWSPVEEVSFSQSAGGDEKTPAPTWRHRDSELTLKPVEIRNDQVVLETNLPAPYNRIRLTNSQPLQVAMKKWEYRVTAVSTDWMRAVIQVDRRSKL